MMIVFFLVLIIEDCIFVIILLLFIDILVCRLIFCKYFYEIIINGLVCVRIFVWYSFKYFYFNFLINFLSFFFNLDVVN